MIVRVVFKEDKFSLQPVADMMFFKLESHLSDLDDQASGSR